MPLHLLILSGMLLGLFASRFSIPRVIAYLLIGILFSKDLLGGALEFNLAEVADVPTIGALGIIAYIIGGSITMTQIQRMGKIIFSTALGESLGAILLVLTALSIFSQALQGAAHFNSHSPWLLLRPPLLRRQHQRTHGP